MRVAIVGGGAAGLATAWLLDAAHEVTLFEKEPILGGHVRTLGGNVPCATLPPGVRLDAGVIELDRHNFPAVHAWLSALGVATPDLEGGGSTTLFLADGRHLRTPAELAAEHLPLGESELNPPGRKQIDPRTALQGRRDSQPNQALGWGVKLPVSVHELLVVHVEVLQERRHLRVDQERGGDGLAIQHFPQTLVGLGHLVDGGRLGDRRNAAHDRILGRQVVVREEQTERRGKSRPDRPVGTSGLSETPACPPWRAAAAKSGEPIIGQSGSAWDD